MLEKLIIELLRKRGCSMGCLEKVGLEKSINFYDLLATSVGANALWTIVDKTLKDWLAVNTEAQ